MKKWRHLFLLLGIGIAAVVAWAVFSPGIADSAGRLLRLRAWFADPTSHPAWQVVAGERCEEAPMLMPTSGYIGFGRGDSFRPGHSHSGFDIFSPDGAVNVTPVVAAYDGYLTREADWKSAVILRHPPDPNLLADDQIWTYYTHMASADGETSFIAPDFPPGTHERFVEAGTLLGFQGNWSGNALRPTGIHLHFSVVKSTASGGYANETDIANTYDPGEFLGVTTNAAGVLACPN